MFKIPELLAPAGGMEQLKAAVENGADAVYMGGKRFNARINAGNFDGEELQEAVEYAHLRGVKLYVTMNTLIRDAELEPALEYAAELYNMGVDALIIQDLGFAELVRKHIPDWNLHLSTQGTVYNIEGVRKAKSLGFSRVVPARELTLQELREITDANLLETEVFCSWSALYLLLRSMPDEQRNWRKKREPWRMRAALQASLCCLSGKGRTAAGGR